MQGNPSAKDQIIQQGVREIGQQSTKARQRAETQLVLRRDVGPEHRSITERVHSVAGVETERYLEARHDNVALKVNLHNVQVLIRLTDGPVLRHATRIINWAVRRNALFDDVSDNHIVAVFCRSQHNRLIRRYERFVRHHLLF